MCNPEIYTYREHQAQEEEINQVLKELVYSSKQYPTFPYQKGFRIWNGIVWAK